MGEKGDVIDPTSRSSDASFHPIKMPSLDGDAAAALIVDDDEDDVEILADLLTDAGYQCAFARDAHQARCEIAQREFSLALVDVMLPGETGLELVEELASRSPRLAVVMVTGMDDRSMAERALRSGVYGYLIKPFRPTELLVTIANAVYRLSLESQRDAFERELEQQLARQAEELRVALEQLDRAVREEMISESEARFRGLLEAAPDAILVVDRGGVVMLINAQAERLFGYSREDMEGQPIELLVPESRNAIHPVLEELHVSDRRRPPMGDGSQLVGRRSDGSEFPAEISLSAIETPEGVFVSASVRNITERLRAQAEREELRAVAERERMQMRLLQAQRLESLGQLAGGVAHDFNNLLSAILNYAAFTREEVDASVTAGDQPDWPSLRADVVQIEKAAQQAAQLTRQLLAFARREPVNLVNLSINDVIGEVDQLLRRTLGGHVEFVTSPGEDLWPVTVDRGQIEQVLLNLAVNARDAMPNGGTLRIETANVRVDQEYASGRPGLMPGEYVSLKVSDTGTGMPREVADRVFEPFYTTKASGEGTGLGLATVYGIVQQAAGHIEVVSEEDSGTMFSILLPASPSADVEPPPVLATAPGGNGETVLLVEDQEVVRNVAERLLSRNGYEVLTADSGPAALALLKETGASIDLLLTDLVMPHMFGQELAQRVTEERPGVATVYMSGNAQPTIEAGQSLNGEVILIQKPFTETELLSKLREALGRR